MSLLVATAFGLALSAATPSPAAAAPATHCKGPFKALLEASSAEKRGVTLFFGGQSVAGIVTACHDDGRIELRAQQYNRIVVLADRIDAAAL